MDQFIEESSNTLADLISIKGSTIAFLDPEVKIQKVDPSKRILRLSIGSIIENYVQCWEGELFVLIIGYNG